MFRASILGLTACLAGLIAIGCSPGRQAAEAELTAARNALNAVDTGARDYVADEVRAIQETIDSATARFERAEYQETLAAAQDAHTRANQLPDSAAARKAVLEAAWTSIRDSLPPMLQQIAVEVNRLSNSRQLPAGLSRSQLNEVKAALEVQNGAWAQAVREFEAGNLAAAVTRADSVRTGVTQMMRTLGMRTA